MRYSKNINPDNFDQKLYKSLVNLPTLKTECFLFNIFHYGSFFVKHFVFFKPTNLQALLSSTSSYIEKWNLDIMWRRKQKQNMPSMLPFKLHTMTLLSIKPKLTYKKKVGKN